MIEFNQYRAGKERCTTCTCRAVPDAHVVLYEMCMSCCTRCACHAVRDVHVMLYEMHISYIAPHRRREYFSKAKAIYLFLIFRHKHIAPDVQYLFIRGYTILI